MKIIYLACPYSHPDPAVRLARHEAANRATAQLMERGHGVYSPLSHSHPIAVQEKLNVGWEFWRDLDLEMLRRSDEVVVLTIDGWDKSVGVQAELEEARRLNKPVTLWQDLYERY